MNSHKLRELRLYAMMGYKIAEQVLATELKVGDKVIVLTQKGEPVMSGMISEVSEDGQGSVVVHVGDRFYNSSEYMFRYV